MKYQAEAMADRLRARNPGAEVRVLPDHSVAMKFDLLTTRAIALECNDDGYQRRYCFADFDRADAEFAKLQTEDDMPEGWVAKRD